MDSKTSRDLPGPGPREDSDRDTRAAVVKTPDKTNERDRDAVHGDGDTIGLGTERGVESK